MHLALAIVLTTICFFRGDWKQIRTYDVTIMYIMICDLLYNMLCQHKLLWRYVPDLFPEYHIFADLLHTFINLPCLTLLYLNRYPYNTKLSKQCTYIGTWVIGSFLVELLFLRAGSIVLQNGYKTWMEIPFYTAMYVMLRLHHTKRTLTYVLSIIIIIFLMTVFKIPLKNQ